ncbi:hypothetical protein [Malaciobacter mytili]|uniref:hypothetical protein n=1 Tax=Malaciobacter mytili TaxID=603050 RepID=UPI003A8A419F
MKNNKKKSSPLFLIITVVIIGVFSFIFFKNNSGFGTSIFSPDIKGSGSVNEHIPAKLRWKKAFRFDTGGSDDSKESSSQNFLQYESQKNKNK